MRALTISQPWAEAIASGQKWVENRTWETRHIGPLAIHAGKGRQYLSRKALERYPTGCILAVATLSVCVRLDDLYDLDPLGIMAGRRVHEILDHAYTSGPWCWILERVRPLDEPVAMRGEVGLWSVPVGQAERLERWYAEKG